MSDSRDTSIFLRMLPHKKEGILNQWVHEEFEKYGDVLMSSMPLLRKLEVSHGYFALRTA